MLKAISESLNNLTLLCLQHGLGAILVELYSKQHQVGDKRRKAKIYPQKICLKKVRFVNNIYHQFSLFTNSKWVKVLVTKFCLTENSLQH